MDHALLDDNQCTQNAQTLLHPSDPSVEKEYAKLAEAWRKQLTNRLPSQPTKDFIRLAWIRLMDYYLDQQWLDSKQMLQCAQAWSSQQTISVTQAVHTMKIISLKSMRRSLETRRELLQVFDDSQLMTSFGVEDSTTSIEQMIKERLSIADSDDGGGSEGGNLPRALFAKHLNSSSDDTLTLHDEGILTPEEVNRYIQFIGHDWNRESKVFNGDNSKNQSDTDLSQTIHNSNKSTSSASSKSNHLRLLMPSRSTPNMSSGITTSRKFGSKELTRSYDTYYEKLHQILPWKEFNTESTISVGNSSINTDGGHNSIKFNWKNWFHEEEPENSSSEPLIEADAEYFPAEEPFANEKVEADAALMTEFYKSNSTPLALMVDDNTHSQISVNQKKTSVSSLSPISNNRASRNSQHVQHSQTEGSEAQKNLYPSYVKIGERDLITYTPRSGRKSGSNAVSTVAIAKSNSSPTHTNTANANTIDTTSLDKLTNSNPSSKERTFTIRNMQKKMSLPKLFGNKKAAAAAAAAASSNSNAQPTKSKA